MPQPSPARASPLVFVFLTVFIDLLGFGIVIPLLPIYSKAYEATDTELGLLFGCFSGMQFLFAPLWGRLSDRIGRKPVLVGGLIGTAASYLVFAESERLGAWWVERIGIGGASEASATLACLFASRLLAGFFGANISTASAYIADVTTPENRAKGMGLIGVAFGLGFTFGPFVGGELSQVSLSLPGHAAAGLSLAAAGFGAWKLREPDRVKHASSPIFSLDDVRSAARSARLSTPLALAFLGVLAFSAFESMFVLFGLALFPTYFGLQQAIEHATREETFAAARYSGRYLFVVGLISAAIQGGLIRRLVPRFGETRLAIVGPLVLGLGLAIVGLAPSFAWVVLGCVVMPLGFGLNNPSVGSLISRSAPAHQQGAVLGLQQSLQSLARLTGPWLAGLCFTALGPRSPFFGATLVLALAALLAWNYHRRFGAGFAPARAPSA